MRNPKTLIAAMAAAGIVTLGSASAWTLHSANPFQNTAAEAQHGDQGADAATQDGNGVAVKPAPTTAPPVVAPIAAPNYRGIVERFGPAVVGITVEGTREVAQANVPPDLQNDPFFRFFRGLPIPQIPRGEAPMHGQGSGFVVASDGVILTNAHVVRDADDVTVKLADRREFKAKVLGVDTATDVAVLKIDAKDLPTVELGHAANLHVGDYVLAIGSPFGFEESATSGIVSAKGRSLPGDSYVPFIQTDVAVNPGNSGGPLFDAGGRVVGINSQIYSRTGGYQGLSFAIPIDVAMRVKDQIVATGKATHAQLGVTIQALNRGLAQSFKLDSPDGALISSVAPGSAAEKAGLKAGDVVLSVDGKHIGPSTDLAAMVGMASPGQRIELQVMRDGSKRTITAQLGEAESQKTASATEESNGDSGRLGLAVRPLQPEERESAHVAKGGLVVEGVTGAAERAGIRPGDVILSVNGTPVTGVDALRKQVNGDEQHLALLVQRGSARIFVPLDLG